MEIIQEIVETWTMNNNGTLYLLENIETEWLPAKLAGKGRSIGEQFVHINNVRSMWVNKVGEKIDLKLDKEKAVNKNELKTALELSSLKMAETLTNLVSGNTAKGYKPHPTAFLARMIAHESHHRGQIMATISRNDLKISKSVNFKLWSYWR